MNITIIHRYFWPDNAPYAQMLLQMALALSSEEGNAVSVISSQPSHSLGGRLKAKKKETFNNVNILRVSLLPEHGRRIVLRAVNTILFAVQVFFQLLFRRTNVVMIASTPPVIMAAVVRWASKIRKFKYVYHCQDIHPEAMNSVGALNDGYLYKLLVKIDVKNVNHALRTVVLSQDMKNTLVSRGCDSSNIKIINNFIFEENGITNKGTCLDPGTFNILFAGNLGRFQNLELIVGAAKKLVDIPEINFIFLGDGVMKNHLQDEAGDLVDKTVHFNGKVDVGRALEYMAEADLGLVSIAKGVVNVAYPSKTMMYLSQGLPLLVLVGKSEMADFVEVNELGVVTDTDSPEVLAELICELYEKRQELNSKKQIIKKLAINIFGAEKVLSDWKGMFKGFEKNV